MAAPNLHHLAHDLEWLGCELEYLGHKHALEGFPERGPTWETFKEKQDGVMRTADKIEHELKDSVRYNPARLVGIAFPLEQTLNSVTDLLVAVEEIKHAAEFSVNELPGMVRNFTRLADAYLGAIGTVSR